MSLQSTIFPMSADTLQTVLQEMKMGIRPWDEESKYIIVKSMIKHIGTTNDELRDHLIYGTFYWLIENDYLEHALLVDLLDTCLNDLLFLGIGEKGTDSVFTRAFTTLLMALILYKDNKDDFLTKSKVMEIKEKLILYINLEQDLRGYVSEKGWAHSVAHVADTFNELIESPKVDQESYPDILHALWSKVFISDSVYVHGEDERLIVPIKEMLERGLDQKEIIALIQHIPVELNIQKDQLDPEEYWFLVFNCKTFLKSLHIKINGIPQFVSLQKRIEACLTAM
ncbi:DUF2785 domain-containing protein [Peribacillus sp. NPDC097295]|uniref:DUF2785 domain-containing protein n=1 Tax=Peribacillus sp. NPDC097295 TaxID=3364402 RepID=UPI003811CEDB